jgi:hypothetical protein
MSLNALSREMLRQQPSVKREDREPEPSVGEKAIDVIAKFIPTELLAPYVAALSLINEETVEWKGETVYVLFIAATPIAFLLFHFAKIAVDKTKSWPKMADLPLLVWKTAAATAAFAVWAIAVPTNQLQTAVGGAAVAGFIAIAVSPVLTAVDVIMVRLFGPKQ